jgi:hypothetical protein
VVGFTIGSRGKVPGKTCEKRIRNNNNNNNNEKLMSDGGFKTALNQRRNVLERRCLGCMLTRIILKWILKK